MLVRFIGFHIEADPGVSVNELMETLSSKKMGESDFKEEDRGRFLFIDTTTNNKYHLGLVVTVKDQRTFCELQASGESFKVVVNNLDANSSLMEFNFFVINKKTGVGLYQHYHQSCSHQQAMYLLKIAHGELIDAKRKERTSVLVASGKSDQAAEKSANKEFQKRIHWQILIQNDKLEDILLELDRIKALEVDFASFDPDETSTGMLTGHLRKRRHRYSFVPTKRPAPLVRAILGYIKANNPEQGRVFGVDENGIDRIIRIQDNPDNFGEFDYDAIAKKINDLDVSQFSNCWVTKELLATCARNKHVFETAITK